jgi:pimeloyl-ACP methyl ester carboxylesterase
MAYPSLLFIHGAANAAWVWDAWRKHLRPFGWDANVLDLRGHGRSLPVDFNTVTMQSYVEDVESVTQQISAAQSRHPVVIGWSMGGLIAMLYAMNHPEVPALVLLSPSPPQEVAPALDPEERRRTPAGPYGPELYGLDPADPAAAFAALPDLTEAEAALVLQNSAGAQESGVARRERLRGISVPSDAIACPKLIVYGEDDRHFAADQNRRLAEYLGAEALPVPETGHWGVIYHEVAVAETAMRVSSWLRRVLKP